MQNGQCRQAEADGQINILGPGSYIQVLRSNSFEQSNHFFAVLCFAQADERAQIITECVSIFRHLHLWPSVHLSDNWAKRFAALARPSRFAFPVTSLCTTHAWPLTGWVKFSHANRVCSNLSLIVLEVGVWWNCIEIHTTNCGQMHSTQGFEAILPGQLIEHQRTAFCTIWRSAGYHPQSILWAPATFALHSANLGEGIKWANVEGCQNWGNQIEVETSRSLIADWQNHFTVSVSTWFHRLAIRFLQNSDCSGTKSKASFTAWCNVQKYRLYGVMILPTNSWECWES